MDGLSHNGLLWGWSFIGIACFRDGHEQRLPVAGMDRYMDEMLGIDCSQYRNEVLHG